jgi:beta/gamma crystallin
MRKHCLLVFLLLVITPIGTKRLSSAQQRQMGGVGITVFADRNFRGKSATFQEDVPDLARYGLNDRISSLRVAPGEQWEVCEHSNYQGRCAVFSGDEPRLTDSSWGDVISSLRRVGGGAVFPPGGAVPPSQSGWYIVLFDQPSYRGTPTNYKGPVPALSGYSRPAQSVTIGRGVWQLCEGTNFTGHCVVLDKSVPDLHAYGLRNRLSSLRPFQEGGGSVLRPTPPPQSGWYIVLFDQPSYRGTPTNYKGPVPALSGYSRPAKSVTIGRGVWELCEGTNFTGHCVILDKSVPDLDAYGLRNRLSSLRPFEGGGSSGLRPTPPPQSDWYIVLYDQPSYRGTPTTYKGAISHLSGSDRRAQSVTIGKGVWEVCEGTNFSGRCVILDKSVPDLNGYGMRNRISSVRPVSPQPR